MKLLSPIPQRKARIEIVPLIDIMFFLLACMMLVSLNLAELKGVPLNLPVSTSAEPERNQHPTVLSLQKSGQIFLDKQSITRSEVASSLALRKQSNAEVRVLVQADADARHGDVLGLLDAVRKAGISKVSFQTADAPTPVAQPEQAVVPAIPSSANP